MNRIFMRDHSLSELKESSPYPGAAESPHLINLPSPHLISRHLLLRAGAAESPPRGRFARFSQTRNVARLRPRISSHGKILRMNIKTKSVERSFQVAPSSWHSQSLWKDIGKRKAL